MAISGAGGWLPSTLVILDRSGNIECIGTTHNVPKSHVEQDMTTVAFLLRTAPRTPVRVDVKKMAELRELVKEQQ